MGSQAYAAYRGNGNSGNQAIATGNGYAQAGSFGDYAPLSFTAVAGTGEIVIKP